MVGEKHDRGTRFLRAAAGALTVSLALSAAAMAQTATAPGTAPRPTVAPQTTAPAAAAPRPTVAPQAAAPAPQAGAPAQQTAQSGPQWIKLCSPDPSTKKNLCLVQHEIVADTGQFIASATFRSVQDDPKMLFILGVPPGMMIQPGLRVQVDEGKQSELKFTICFPNTCFADMEATPDFVKSVKAGKQLIIIAVNQGAQTVSFPISLAGFTKAYDSVGVDPNTPTGQAALDALSASLKAHADEARQRLISQQQARPAQ
jgi:invasion protein IalB